jgi:hypothetical protein
MRGMEKFHSQNFPKNRRNFFLDPRIKFQEINKNQKESKTLSTKNDFE